ncbi:MAG: hypothetical protein JJ992_07380, partial [Planctomycetes bacterium]|nr:hypothetical protein [Planctomycetota bacterium]
DVDFYQFDIQYSDPFSLRPYETIFDVDYAGGLDARPNVSLHVFDSNGRLILTSRDANIAEDRPGTPFTSDIDDLSRGTVAPTDPFIGIVDLNVGTYYVAVTADTRMPDQLDQFTQANATNPNVRVEPIRTVRRIAEDDIDPFVNDYSTADPPQITYLFDKSSDRSTSDGEYLVGFETMAEVPWYLGDVTLFLQQDQAFQHFNVADPTSTTILTVDPFTGAAETKVGWFDRETGDIVMDASGQLYAYSLSRNEPIICTPNDNLSGNFLVIDPSDASLDPTARDDGIETYERDPANAAASQRTRTGTICGPIGDGIEFNAITTDNVQVTPDRGGFAVGDRGFSYLLQNNPNLMPGVEIVENILYRFDDDPNSANLGEAFSSPNPDKADNASNPPGVIYLGAGTQIRERGELLTSPRLEAVGATRPTGTSHISVLQDGQTFTVVDGANRTTFEFDTGLEVTQNIDTRTDSVVKDGNFFLLDENLFQFDMGSDIVFSGAGSQVQNAVVTVNDGAVSHSYEYAVDANDQKAPNATRLDPSPTSAQLASDLANAINADFTTIRAHAAGPRVSIEGDFTAQLSAGARGVRIEGDTGVAPILQPTDGSQLADGQDFYIQSDGQLQRFEFDSGYTLQIPVRFMLQMPAAGGRGIQDGEFFVIGNTTTGAVVTFEMDLGGTTRVVAPNRVLIGYDAIDSADAIAREIVDNVLDVVSNPTLDDGAGNQVGGAPGAKWIA